MHLSAFCFHWIDKLFRIKYYKTTQCVYEKQEGCVLEKQNDIEVAKRIKELRIATGLTRKEFCEEFEIPLRTVEDWEAGRRKMPEYLIRLMEYKIRIETMMYTKMDRKSILERINVIEDEEGRSIVIINDIRFKGKQNISWNEVETYLKEYVGSCYEILETSDKIYIGSDFPGELKGSEDTKRLRGGNAKAKANATQELPLLLEYASNKRYNENMKSKHELDAGYGWYRFTSRFALPVYSNTEELERYNIFRIEMLIRHASDGKMYLYDMVNVKKETEYPA